MCCEDICCETFVNYETKMCLLEVVTNECESRRIFTEVTELKRLGWLVAVSER